MDIVRGKTKEKYFLPHGRQLFVVKALLKTGWVDFRRC